MKGLVFLLFDKDLNDKEHVAEGFSVDVLLSLWLSLAPPKSISPAEKQTLT